MKPKTYTIKISTVIIIIGILLSSALVISSALFNNQRLIDKQKELIAEYEHYTSFLNETINIYQNKIQQYKLSQETTQTLAEQYNQLLKDYNQQQINKYQHRNQTMCSNNALLHNQGTGTSMLPAIHPQDYVWTDYINPKDIQLGDIVAYNIDSYRYIMHSVILVNETHIQTQGYNELKGDEPVEKKMHNFRIMCFMV